MQLTNLGNFLKQKREYIGLTQFQFAELANIDEKHYGKIERNECINMTLSTLCQISHALETEPYQLLKDIMTSN